MSLFLREPVALALASAVVVDRPLDSELFSFTVAVYGTIVVEAGAPTAVEGGADRLTRVVLLLALLIVVPSSAVL